MNYILGIDGGGTKTIGILASIDGHYIANVQAGPSNYHAVGIDQTSKVLNHIVSQLSKHVDNFNLNDIYFCIGMAGLGRAEDKKTIGKICDKIGINKKRILTHDAHIALIGGIGKQEGVIVISGTGSIVYGIDTDDKEIRAGGWGYILGDEGSGYDIALQGLRAVVRAADNRGPQTRLTNLMLQKLDLNEPNDLIRWIHAASRDDIAQLAAVVFDASGIGDAKSDEIIDGAVRELARAVETVTTQLELTHPYEIVFSGGILLNQPILANKLKRWIEKKIIGSTVIYPKHEPAYGAVLLAKAHI